MDAPAHDCQDLDRLLRLIGILGDPALRGFWDSWRHDRDGYGFKKIKAGIAAIAREDGMHDHWAHDFADYVLMLFARKTPEEEAELVLQIGRHITSGDPQAVGSQFLADLRRTAWQVWRDHQETDAATVIQQWENAPFPWESEKWKALRGE
ncbi:hypothetical protein [Streptomyces fradiae]|uniref:hypothetical protein n=1 Tax=Streptomyces fradiae TaxID=1906 RepID=UPI0033DCD06B